VVVGRAQTGVPKAPIKTRAASEARPPVVAGRRIVQDKPRQVVVVVLGTRVSQLVSLWNHWCFFGTTQTPGGSLSQKTQWNQRVTETDGFDWLYL